MVIFKFFTLGAYDKKEKWINEMCSNGYALKDCSTCRFDFEKCTPDEYYYSLELLENLPPCPDNEDFINYLNDEWGIQYVCQYQNWVFFRRKKSLGKFELFHNIGSQVCYFKRILTFRLTTIVLLLVFAVLNIIYSTFGSIDKISSVLLILILIIAFIVNIPTFIKYRKLKKSDES